MDEAFRYFCLFILISANFTSASAQMVRGDAQGLRVPFGIGCPFTYTKELETEFCYLVCKNVRINGTDESQDMRNRGMQKTPPAPPLYRLECRPKQKAKGVQIEIPSLAPTN